MKITDCIGILPYKNNAYAKNQNLFLKRANGSRTTIDPKINPNIQASKTLKGAMLYSFNKIKLSKV